MSLENEPIVAPSLPGGDEQEIGPPSQPPNAVPHREKTRSTIAFILVSMLAGMIGISLLGGIFGPLFPCFDKSFVLEMLKVVLPPTVALVGTVTGFYYGANSR